MQSLRVAPLRCVDSDAFKKDTIAREGLSRLGESALASVPQLLDAARVLLNAIVDLQNTFENDWASLVDARAARCDRAYGDSPLAATRPLLAYCARFAEGVLPPDGATPGLPSAHGCCRAAALKVSTFAREALGHAPPRADPASRIDAVHTYLRLIVELVLDHDALDSVAARLAALGRIDLVAVDAALEACALAARETIAAVKAATIRAVGALEDFYDAALGGATLSLEALEPAAALVDDIDNIVEDSFVAPVSRRVDGPVDPSRRAASLGELQALSADAAKRPARGAENPLAFIGLDTAIDKHVTNWN